jgi:lipid-A-disaccharide synthase-like uncharacterized protein
MEWIGPLWNEGWGFLANLTAWEWVGYIGHAFFFSRFLVQWIASERRGESVVPVAFWYLSLIGSAMVLSYAIYRRDKVFIPAFSLNMIIYLRNLALIYRKKAPKTPPPPAATCDPDQSDGPSTP